MSADAARELVATAERRPLRAKESAELIGAALESRLSATETARVLTALHLRGETADELEGCVRAMLRRAVRIAVGVRRVMDVGGTGGDGARTFNVSTTAALVVAAAEVPVVKHGNVAVTGASGSVDMLRDLGVPVPADADPKSVLEQVDATGFAVAPTRSFLRLPQQVSVVRRRLPFRTIFNLAGPLAHPATALRAQVVGAPTVPVADLLAEVMRRVGRRRVSIVHGRVEGRPGGLDEPSLCGTTRIVSLRDGELDAFDVTPDELGLEPAPLETLVAGDAAASAATCRRVLDGERGPARDVVCFMAGIGLWTADAAESIAGGVQQAADAIDGGAAAALLDRLTYGRTEAAQWSSTSQR